MRKTTRTLAGIASIAAALGPVIANSACTAILGAAPAGTVLEDGSGLPDSTAAADGADDGQTADGSGTGDSPSGEGSLDGTSPADGPLVDVGSDAVMESHDSGQEAGCSGLTCSGKCVGNDDATNCGSCNHSCLGGTCLSGSCQPALVYNAGSLGAISAIASNGTAVAWADYAANTISYVTQPGGTPMTLANAAHGGVSNPVSVAFAVVNGSTVVDWLQNGTGNVVASGYALAGTALSGVLSTEDSPGGGNPYGLVSDTAGDYLFYMNYTGSYLDLLRIPSNGNNESLYIDEETTEGGGYYNVALSPNTAVNPSEAGYAVYAASEGTDVFVYSFTGGTATMISGYTYPWVAADNTNAYFSSSGTIYSVPLASPGVTPTMIGQTGSALNGMATDGTNVYFISNSALYYVPVGGSTHVLELGTATSGMENLKLGGSKALYYDNGEAIYLVAIP